MNINNQTSNKQLKSLQALRGLGAISVVIFHALSLFPFMNFRAGAAGVDLFFVISGVVMYLSVKPTTSPFDFLKKRCIRVIPMYWIASAIAVAYFYARYPDVPPSSEHIIRSFLFAPPPAGFNMPVLYPGWTLNYEMFFYAVLGLMLCIGRLAIPATICLIITLGAALPEIQIIKQYYFNQIILEFAAGLVIGHAIKSGYRPKKPEAALFIAASILLFTIHNIAVSDGVIAWGIPSVLLVLGAIGFEDSKLIKGRVVQFLGESSYSIYLFHAIAIWVVSWIWPGQPGPEMVLAAVLLSLLIGVIAFKYLESPLLRLMTKPARSSSISKAASPGA